MAGPSTSNSGNVVPVGYDKDATQLMAGGQRVPVMQTTTDANGNTVIDTASMAAMGASDLGLSANENRYAKALFFGTPITNLGSVKDFSLNGADLVYCGSTTDAEVYNTLAGYLSTLGGTKGLQVPMSKLQWDLNAGQSLFVQARVMKPTALANEHAFGNGRNGIDPGFFMAVSSSGPLQPYVKCGVGSAQLMGNSSNIAADTPFNVTFWIDGGSKLFNGWLNGGYEVNWKNKVIAPDGGGSYATTTPGQLTSWNLGNSGDIVSPGNRPMNNFRFATMRVMVIPAGKTLQNAAMLDYRFNRDPSRLLTANDLALV